MDTTGGSAQHNEKLLLEAKKWVLDFHRALDGASGHDVKNILDKYTTESDFVFRSVYPFRDFLTDKRAVADTFWNPLKASFTHLHRRTQLFFGGRNSLHPPDGEDDAVSCDRTQDDDKTFWIVSMGHFVGLLDRDWLGIRATRKMTNLRFAEFTQVVVAKNADRHDTGSNVKICQQALFFDLVGLMQDNGLNPLPISSGQYYVYPGPASGNGMEYAYSNAPVKEGQQTQALVDRMVDDLTAINHLVDTPCPPDVLRRTWHEDMIWYGPAGIGATMTIPRYQEQHQYPFRQQLTNKKFAGHVARVAEGEYAAFFGWPCNLTNTPQGGFLGLPGTSDSRTPCPMQVVDVYRRRDDKLAENWVLIDIPWYLKAQGLDVLARTTGIQNPLSTCNPVGILGNSLGSSGLTVHKRDLIEASKEDCSFTISTIQEKVGNGHAMVEQRPLKARKVTVDTVSDQE